MDKAEFDRFADEYYGLHKANIAVTGEGPEYFAEYKVRDLRSTVDRYGIAVSSICDFGSGVGNSLPFFRKYFPNAAITCSDVSERSLALSEARFPGLGRNALIDSERIPADQNTFDVTFSACVFHHIPENEHVAWLRELHRITRPGGLLSIFEHNPLNPLTVRAVNTCPFDENARLMTAPTLAGRFRDAGWSAPEIRYRIFFPRVLSWLRPLEPKLGWLPLGAQYVITARKA